LTLRFMAFVAPALGVRAITQMRKHQAMDVLTRYVRI
jgi:hypothetical protein